MKALIGLAMALIFLPTAWWAFDHAVNGQDFYNWIWVPATVIGVVGVLTIIAQVRNWINS